MHFTVSFSVQVVNCFYKKKKKIEALKNPQSTIQNANNQKVHFYFGANCSTVYLDSSETSRKKLNKHFMILEYVATTLLDHPEN